MLSRLFPFLLALLFPLCLHAADQPNIVWINCEDMDEILGCYGDSHAITPNLNRLAEEGILYRNAFANAPICAPARSCLITGMYPTSLGSQHLRCEIEPPDFVEAFPTYLKDAGYFVTNYAKTDYNFSPDGIYDYWKQDYAPWRQRKDAAEPFFSFFVFGRTHEGPANFQDRYEKAVETLSPEKFTDPDSVEVPAYFPNSPKIRELWARYYDLAAALDDEVGLVIDGLKEDGLWDNTIVWFFSDHGHGLPRHKRWLLDSGLRVPFLVRVPEKYQHLAAGIAPGSETERLVSFVDFAPTVLSMADVPIPGHMQGEAFLGNTVAEPQEFIYGARDRADDMFELSRAVHDGRYIYIRHYLPHLPYIQGGKIMGDQKESMAELRRARDAGELDEISSLIWAKHKPVEELYDLQADPREIHNLAQDPAQQKRLKTMRAELRRWILDHRDTGFLTEPEYHRRASEAGTSIREMALDPQLYDLPAILTAAETVGDPNAELPSLDSPDPGIRYWTIIARMNRESTQPENALPLLEDPNPSVAIATAEWLCSFPAHADNALPVLERYIESEDRFVALLAARSMFNIGKAAQPAVERIEAVRKSLEAPPGSRRLYRDFNYASFAGWALESALINCGAATEADFE